MAGWDPAPVHPLCVGLQHRGVYVKPKYNETLEMISSERLHFIYPSFKTGIFKVLNKFLICIVNKELVREEVKMQALKNIVLTTLFV